MKKYTFTLPKNNNTAKSYKNTLMNRIITAYPWMTVESKYDNTQHGTGIQSATGGDMITVGLDRYNDVSWLPEMCKNCPFMFDGNVTNFDLEKEFFAAIEALNSYAMEHCPFDADYDYKDVFGTPVKIFDNFVQIGYDIIPISRGSLDHLKKETKKKVIEITINIKTRGLF